MKQYAYQYGTYGVPIHERGSSRGIFKCVEADPPEIDSHYNNEVPEINKFILPGFNSHKKWEMVKARENCLEMVKWGLSRKCMAEIMGVSLTAIASYLDGWASEEPAFRLSQKYGETVFWGDIDGEDHQCSKCGCVYADGRCVACEARTYRERVEKGYLKHEPLPEIPDGNPEDLFPNRHDSPKGERSCSAKLTNSDVLWIVLLHFHYGVERKLLAKIFGVTRTTPDHILNGAAWSDVTGIPKGYTGRIRRNKYFKPEKNNEERT